MANIFRNISDTDFPDSSLENQLENGDILYWSRNEFSQIHIYQKNNNLLQYKYPKVNFKGLPGGQGSDGSPSTLLTDPNIIPAIHSGDTTPNAFSTYWIKSNGKIYQQDINNDWVEI